jgi:Zn-dependent protease
VTGPGKDYEDPLDRLAAEEDWSRRVRAAERDASRQRRSSTRVPRPRVRLARRRGRVSLFFLALVAISIASGCALWFGARPVSLIVFVFVLAAWLVSVTLHEFSHALIAHRGGDDTVVDKGYLRLDMRAYGHPLLTFGLPLISLLLGGIPLPGAAVMIEKHRLRNRFQDLLVSAAGPSVNVVLSLLLLAIVSGLGPAGIYDLAEPHAAFWAALTFLAYLQVVSVILNLLPVPPLDGYGMIEPYLSYDARKFGNAVKPFGLLVVFGLLYVPPIREAFGHVTQGILDLAGAPVNGEYFGFKLFQFWKN